MMEKSYFFDKYRLSAKRKAIDDVKEKSPTSLDPKDVSGGFMAVSADKLSIKYTGLGLHYDDMVIVRANHPARIDCLAYYFEMNVKNAGEKGDIMIGLANERISGFMKERCDYHGNDGGIYLVKSEGLTVEIGETYTTGDTVGCGIDYVSQEFFFTKNAVLVKSIPRDLTGHLYPTVSVHGPNGEVSVNFGMEAFAFDFNGYEASVRKKRKMEIENICIYPSISHGLVRTYLLHYGYEESLKAFDMATESAVPPIDMAQTGGFDDQELSYSLHDRENLRKLIMKGEMDTAIAILHDIYPQLVQNDKSEVCFLLHCQKFIELIRSKETANAVIYARVELAKFSGLARFRDIVKDCFGLIAYKRPEESNVGYFLGETQKEVVADGVNAAILWTNPNNKSQLHSRLERVLRQLTLCSAVLNRLKKHHGELFSLHKLLNNNI